MVVFKKLESPLDKDDSGSLLYPFFFARYCSPITNPPSPFDKSAVSLGAVKDFCSAESSGRNVASNPSVFGT